MKDDDDLLTRSREIFAFGEIDSDFAKNLVKDICHLRSLKKDPITIFLSSPGGEVGFGLGLYDLIQSLQCHVTVVGVGEVASAATLILQAADRRIMTVNSIMMLHGLTISAENTIPNLETFLRTSKFSQECMLNIYAQRSGLTKANLKSRLQRDWYLSSSEALELGFIDERI